MTKPAVSEIPAWARPLTYREAIEYVLVEIERQAYGSTKAPPTWVMALAPVLYRVLDRNER